MSGTWLVIPSNRMDNLRQFFQAWEGRGGWDRVVIVEDAPERSHAKWLNDLESCKGLHFSHKEIADTLGDAAWIISRKDSACRCFGFLVAWWGGANHVLTLDDDVRPHDGRVKPDLVARHLRAMIHSRWLSSVFGLRVRGLPYGEHGLLPDVVANVGLWTNHPDLDAVGQLSMMASHSKPSYFLPESNWILPRGQFAPICGMNLMLARKALPLAYFPLMGEGQPFARMDDIWMGVILNHCCDALGWSISVGNPVVDHQKASDPFVNLVKEAPGIKANEEFWQSIAKINLIQGHGALGNMHMIGERLKNGWITGEHDGYWHRLGKAILRWVDLLKEKPNGLEGVGA